MGEQQRKRLHQRAPIHDNHTNFRHHPFTTFLVMQLSKDLAKQRIDAIASLPRKQGTQLPNGNKMTGGIIWCKAANIVADLMAGIVNA